MAAARSCLFLLLSLLLLLARGGPTAGQAAPLLADTTQVRAQLAAGRRLLARHTDSALALNRQLLRSSERLHYPYGQAQGALQLGIALRNAGEFDSSFAYARRAQALFEAQHRLAGVAAVYNLNA